MRELTDQQRLFLIESEQILTAWRDAYRPFSLPLCERRIFGPNPAENPPNPLL